MARAGLSPVIEIVDFRFVVPTASLAQKLELPPEERETLCVTRKYSPRGQEAIALTFAHIPQRFGRYFSRGDIERYQICAFELTLIKGCAIIPVSLPATIPVPSLFDQELAWG
jgi:hypothetical protein